MGKLFQNIRKLYIPLYFYFFIASIFSAFLISFFDFYTNIKFDELINLVEKYKKAINASVKENRNLVNYDEISEFKQSVDKIKSDAIANSADKNHLDNVLNQRKKALDKYNEEIQNKDNKSINDNSSDKEKTISVNVQYKKDGKIINQKKKIKLEFQLLKFIESVDKVLNDANIDFNIIVFFNIFLRFFFIGSIIIIIYLIPVYKYSFSNKKNYNQKIENRIINLQLFIVFLSIFFAVLAFGIRSIYGFEYFQKYHVLKNFILFIIYSSIISYLIVFLTGTYIKNRIALPVFKENNLYGVKKGHSVNLSGRVRLLIFSLAITPLIITLMISITFSFQVLVNVINGIVNKEMINVDVTKLIYTVIPMFFICIISGLFFIPQVISLITFKRNVQGPINRLIERMNIIRKGDFTSKASVLAADEIGQLRGHFNDMVEGLQEREKIRSTFGKFVSAEIAEKLIKEGGTSLEGETIETTVMFTDIRDFTSFSENLHPKDIINFLNDYFSHMCNPILENGGVINKFIGDSIMAVFSPVFGVEDHVNSAFKAAIGIRKALKEFNETGKYKEIRHGIGLHTGTLIAGNVGTEERMEYTVIGDTVNVASRIESQTKLLNSDTLMSEEFYNRIDKNKFVIYKFEKFESIKVKGKSKELILYKFS